MPFHLMAFAESVDLSGGGYLGIKPAPPAALEPYGAISGDNFTLNRATMIIAAQLQSELATGVVDFRFHKLGDPNWMHFHLGNADITTKGFGPLLGMRYPISVNEVLVAQGINAAAKLESLLFAMGNPGQLSSVPLPWNKIVSGVGAGTLTADAWTNAGDITWTETFEPSRRYQIVGMAYMGAAGHAARIASGLGVIEKPGCFGCRVTPEDGIPPTWGDFGSFIGTTPPTFECLADTADTAETITLFLR